MLNVKWALKLDGMVRKPIVDQERGMTYVIIYREKARTYILGAYKLETGEKHWETDVVNGGYGTPAQSVDLVVMPYQFTGIVALAKSDGSVVWSHNGVGRVRSTVLFHRDVFYYSSGGELFGIDTRGNVTFHAKHDTAFFFGEPVLDGSRLYSLGVSPDRFGRSIRSIYNFDRNGRLVRADELCEGGIVSSDVSGLLNCNDSLIAGGPGHVVSVSKSTGLVQWHTEIEGDASRHACTREGDSVYFTTLDGTVGALDLNSGIQKWQRSCKEAVYTPATPVGPDSVAFAADGYLYQLSAEDGLLIAKRPIGHSPYSALVLAGGHALIGAGEPPYEGLLISFADRIEARHGEMIIQTQNAFLGSTDIDFVLEVPNVILPESLCVRVTAVSTKEVVEPISIDGNRASFRFTLDSQCAPGDYALPIAFTYSDGTTGTDVALFTLGRKVPLPNKVLLNSIQPIAQEQQNFSGAAVARMLEVHYGYPKVSQSERRKMVDFVRSKSQYLPFDIWRILLRRTMTTSAATVEELPEFDLRQLP